jgi:Rod binding domain-containing protein
MMKISVIDKQIPIEKTGKTSKAEQEIKLLKLKKACQDFESIFIYYMLKSMRTSDSKTNLFGKGLGSDIFMQMFDEGLADKMAASGQLNIAGAMFSKYAAMVGGENNPVSQSLKPRGGGIERVSREATSSQTVSSTNEVKSVEISRVIPDPQLAVPDTKMTSPPVSIDAPRADATAVADKYFIGSPTVSNKTARMKAKVDQYDDIIADAASANKVDPNLVKAVILQESGGNPRAISAKGAKGLMQIMDATAKMLGVTDPFDIKQNIEGGVKYLAQLINKFEGNIQKALAAYNAGPAAVQKYDGVPPYDETTDFVNSVMSHLNGLLNFDKSR